MEAVDGLVRLLPLRRGLYVLTLVAPPARSPSDGVVALPAVEICPPPGAAAGIEITDSGGGTASWLCRDQPMLFVKAARDGSPALVTAYLAPGGPPPELEIRRLGPPDASVVDIAAEAPLRLVLSLETMAAAAAAADAGRVAVDVTAHLSGRGDVRFDDAGWIGDPGPGAWIEALTIMPRDPAAAATIEYKALVGNGAETPWTGCGAICGTLGQALPLIAVAVRQKPAPGPPPGRPLFDCEYVGRFRSGATAGPVRNGAPCRSGVDGDPLAGLQLRILRRPPGPSRSSEAGQPVKPGGGVRARRRRAR